MARETFVAWWHGLNVGQQQALVQKFYHAAGGDKSNAQENFEGVLKGELTAEIAFKDATVVLVDRNGRCIPTDTVTGQVVNANRAYHLDQPEINYGRVLERYKQFFGPEMQFVSAAEFEARATALLGQVGDHKQVKNLRRGVYLPFSLPKLVVADYGRTLKEIFLAAVERSYRAQFPNRPFVNCRKGQLTGQVKIVTESRHNELIEAMRQGPVVGVLFPTTLQGFGIEADREMIAQFPAGFTLTGAIDFAAAHVAYPETLAKDNTPVSDCAALSWRVPGNSLYFNAGDDRLEFNCRRLVAGEECSAGVVVF